MKTLIGKFSKALRQDGPVKAARKAASYIAEVPQRMQDAKARAKFEQDVLQLPSAEARFSSIYERRLWGDADQPGRSVSGRGSSLDYTASLRRALPLLIRNYDIRSIFDAPCGDFNWMKLVLAEVDVQYVGADIVKPLIQSLSQTYGDAKTSFAHLDLIEDALPRVDLMVCRDCLFHLSYAHTHAVLENFARANIRYLLTSTHVNAPRRFDNLDIETGDFRYIDLFDRPYHFAREPLQAIDDWMPPEPPRQLCLWRRDQVIDALARFTPPSDEDGWG